MYYMYLCYNMCYNGNMYYMYNLYFKVLAYLSQRVLQSRGQHYAADHRGQQQQDGVPGQEGSGESSSGDGCSGVCPTLINFSQKKIGPKADPSNATLLVKIWPLWLILFNIYFKNIYFIPVEFFKEVFFLFRPEFIKESLASPLCEPVWLFNFKPVLSDCAEILHEPAGDGAVTDTGAAAADTASCLPETAEEGRS